MGPVIDEGLQEFSRLLSVITRCNKLKVPAPLGTAWLLLLLLLWGLPVGHGALAALAALAQPPHPRCEHTAPCSTPLFLPAAVHRGDPSALAPPRLLFHHLLPRV